MEDRTALDQAIDRLEAHTNAILEDALSVMASHMGNATRPKGRRADAVKFRARPE